MTKKIICILFFIMYSITIPSLHAEPSKTPKSAETQHTQNSQQSLQYSLTTPSEWKALKSILLLRITQKKPKMKLTLPQAEI